MPELTLDQFAEDFRQEVLLRSSREEAESTSLEAFIEVMLDELTSASVMDDGDVAPYRSRGIEAGGYSISEDMSELVLLVPVYKQLVPPPTATSSDIDTAIARGLAFIEKAYTGIASSLEESTPAFDMAIAIRDAAPEIRKIRIIVITDGVAVLREREVLDWRTREVVTDVWDIRRLHQLATSGRPQESIDIDFVEMTGVAIPCLPSAELHADYRALLAIFPASALVEIYDHFGGRLLERNVRAFLQARGKVNSGIRQTILNEPKRFLAYNNGISATASEVVLVDLPGGGKGISRIRDLQIVNGGQTTASLHHLAKRDRERSKVDLSDIYVQAKVSIVATDDLDQIVPLISRYANSQNKVNEADFEANSPYHVSIEVLSRRLWAPAVNGSPRMTHWFYERARGQYSDAQAKEFTPARRREFKLQNPPTQKFTKTDLAKFVNSWDQLPHIVSLGAEKNFRNLTIRLEKERWSEPSHEDFHTLVAKAILYRQTESIVTKQQYGGYRANIVTYTIALLSSLLNGQLDFVTIWDDQKLKEELQGVIRDLSSLVRDVIVSAPGNGNVTEWSKKAECWERVKRISYDIPPGLMEQRGADHIEGSPANRVLRALINFGDGLPESTLARKTGLSRIALKDALVELVNFGYLTQLGDGRSAGYSLIDREQVITELEKA